MENRLVQSEKRMDYENVVDNLKTLKVQLDAVFKKPDTGE